MRMVDMKFLLDTTPSPQQSFGPAFGVSPSTPVSFTVNEALPQFLSFSTETGLFKPNGGKATPASEASYKITAKNTISGEHPETVEFRITVAASTTPPSH
jgi:hypothetical protein